MKFPLVHIYICAQPLVYLLYCKEREVYWQHLKSLHLLICFLFCIARVGVFQVCHSSVCVCAATDTLEQVMRALREEVLFCVLLIITSNIIQ